MIRRLLAATAIVGGLLGAALLFAAPASAHATIVATDPVDGSRLDAVPSTVTITFDEPVGLGSIGYLRVIDQTGRRVDTGTAVHPGGDGSKVTATLRSGLGDSTYTASYRVVSADSHPVAGSVRFVVGNGSLAAGPFIAGSAVNGVTSKVLDTVRGFEFGGLALLGGAWLLVTIWPAGRDDRRARTLAWTGWWTSVVFGAGELLLQGPYDAGTGLGDVTKWSLLDATLHTDFGVAHSLRLIALGIAAIVLGTLLRTFERTRSGLEELAGLLLVAIAVTFATSGHATSQHPRWLATTSDTLHLLAMSAWVGGLAYLFISVLPRRDPDELRRVLPIFSRVAYVSVATLAITGTYQAWLGVGSWRALADTTYGRLVLVKIALFLVLIALGNQARTIVARRWSTARLPVAYAMTDTQTPLSAAGDPSDSGADEKDEFDDDDAPDDEPEPAEVSRLLRGVLIELVLAAAVLGTTGVLVAQPPGVAALAITDSKPASFTVAAGDGRSVVIGVNTQRKGPVSITLKLVGWPAPQQVTATAANSAKQLGPLPVALSAASGSTTEYSAPPVLLPESGSWQISVTVRTSEFDSTVVAATVALH